MQPLIVTVLPVRVCADGGESGTRCTPGGLATSVGGVFTGFWLCAPSTAVPAIMPATARPDQYLCIRFPPSKCLTATPLEEQPADQSS